MKNSSLLKKRPNNTPISNVHKKGDKSLTKVRESKNQILTEKKINNILNYFEKLGCDKQTRLGNPANTKPNIEQHSFPSDSSPFVESPLTRRN